MSNTHKLKVFIIPHWHFDALWQLTFEEYFDITLRNLIDLLEFLEINPEYKFNIDQSIYLEEVKKKYPELFEKLREAVEKGLIEFVCSGYTQPDTNIPSGEFLVRNIVTYQWFVKREFSVKAKCGWMLDSYGHSAQLPQILKKADIDYYVFWRGVSREIPSEFLWEGIDGTRILTHRMPLSYGGGYIPTGEWRYYFFIRTVTIDNAIEFLESVVERLKRRAVTNNIFVPNGNDFTPPQRFIVDVVKEWNKRRDDIEAYIAGASEFFKEVEKFREKLPVIKGEFNPIFRGTYSNRIEIKKANRRIENLYLIAEKFATLASFFGYSYPKEKLERALKLILLNQFHDAINGEVIDEVYDIIMDNFKLAENICKEILEESLNTIVEKIDTDSEIDGIPVIVFNPLSWSRTDIVSIKVAFTDPKVKGVRVFDWKGKEIPCQLTRVNKNPDGSLGLAEVTFIAENVPSLGYKTYYIVPSYETQNYETSIKTSDSQGEYVIENDFFVIKLHPISKGIISIYDKRERREVLKTDKYLGNVLFFEPDFGSVCEVNGELDPNIPAIPIKDLPNPETVPNSAKGIPRGLITERGPVRATLYVYGVIEHSKFKQYIMIYDKIRRIDFITELEFGDENKRVRVVFPINITNGKIFHEIPYGVIERNEGEYPAINWIDFSSEDYGVTLINQGIPGNSVVGNVMMLTLLRSIEAMYLGSPVRERLEKLMRLLSEKFGKYYLYYELGKKALEKGHHVFKYSLYPHKGDWKKAKSYKVAYEFNNPLIAVKTLKHKGLLPKEFSFVSVDVDNLIITVLKRGEESNNDIVIRFYEAEGEETQGCIEFFKKLKEAYEANLLEEKIKPLHTETNRVKVVAKPFEIYTLILKVS